MMLHALDIFFLLFHTLFTLFNITGWMFARTRKIHLVTMLLTAFSWCVLGIWYGWGYCFCTDWHWQVRNALGKPIVYNSYIQFLLHEITGYAPDVHITDITVAGVFIICLFLTVVLNMKDYTAKRKA